MYLLLHFFEELLLILSAGVLSGTEYELVVRFFISSLL